MSHEDLFRIEYRLLTLQKTYSEDVSPNYYRTIAPEYFVDADISFYLNENKFFTEAGFSIYKFILDASRWFKHSFPDSQFVWNEDYFDGWEAIIVIVSIDSQVLFKVESESESEESIEVSMAIADFKSGFAKFLYGFKEKAESFYAVNFDLIELVKSSVAYLVLSKSTPV